MSLIKRMFGLQSPEEIRAEADALFERGEYGSAKLAYERALDKAKGDSGELHDSLTQRIQACKDGIAEGRIAEAERQLELGERDLARDELEGALEVAVDPEVVAGAQRLLDRMDHEQTAEPTAEPETEQSDEERLALLAARWEEPQAEEYERYGEELDRALLALEDGRADEARQLLESLVQRAEHPRYLWIEVARARLQQEDRDGGIEALRTFLRTLAPREGGDTRMSVHMQLAHLADERGDFDGAVAEFEAAIETWNTDPRPYLLLGRYLRSKEHFEEAVEVLQSALELIDTAQPDWSALQELGLAQADAGHTAEATGTLERVLKILGPQRLQIALPAIEKLATLHEKQGQLERAADLCRTLAQSHEAEQRPYYQVQAARLLSELELPDEARRMLQRASALLEEDAELQQEVRSRLEALEPR
jgi:tetratricopeptide (TPR) repeat protein